MISVRFCQARLSPPLIGQIVAEASIEGPEAYSREVYEEYLERRKTLIDGVNRIEVAIRQSQWERSIR